MLGKYKFINYEARKKIEQMYLDGCRALDIAAEVGVHTATIYHELERGYTGTTDKNYRRGYSAEIAERNVRASISRRGRRKVKQD